VQLHVHTNDFVALLLEQRRCDRRIYSAGHRRYDSHAYSYRC
jgi:hypothetical protein